MSPKKKSGVRSPQDLVPDGDKSGKAAPFVSDEYNKVARSAQLGAIVLTASNFSVKPDYFDDVAEGKPDPEYSFNSKVTNEVYDKENGVASCIWEWSVGVKKEQIQTLSISAIYLISYTGITDCNEEAVKRYLRRVGRFATYPYFRAHASQVSWESSTNLPLMPTIAS